MLKIFIYGFLGCFLLVSNGTFAVTKVSLPKPKIYNTMSFDQAIQQRRSVDSFKKQDLTLQQISQLLWAADGITDARDSFRSAPSAGAIYPLTLYVVKKDGVWQYDVKNNALIRTIEGDVRDKLASAAFAQKAIREAPLDIVIVANYQNVTEKYGERGIIYSHIETGHVAQNLALEATSLGLGCNPIGSFDDGAVEELL